MNSRASPLTLLRMTTRNLYRRPVRTSLTALGVAVGVVAIVAFTTIVRGLWDAVDAAIRINDADLLVFQAGIAADILSTLEEEESHAKLMAIPGVASAIGTLWHVMPVEKQPFCMVIGMRLEDMDPGWKHLVKGRNPQADDEVAIGSIARRALGKDLGDELELQGRPYRVVGVYETNVVFFNGGIVLSLPRVQQLAAKEGRVTAFQVTVEPGAEPAAIADAIERGHPEFVAVTDASEYHKADQGLLIADGMVWAISFIALVIGSIIVTNTMWMSVLERTREIGVLRAVGWSRMRIVVMVVLEAAGVGCIAVLLGCPAGVGLAKLAAAMPVSEQFLEPVFDVEPFLLAVLIAVVLSVIGALFPAWRAAHVSPAEALRYE